jgi:hypothetical protein
MKSLFSSSVKRCVLLALISLTSQTLFSQQTNVGTDFWLVFNETYPEDFNANPPQSLELQIFISSRSGASGLVEIEGIAFSEEFDVLPGGLITVTVPDNAFIVGSNTVQDLGIHLSADNPISVYGLNQRAFSSDAFLAIPVSAWTSDYLVMSYSNSGVFVGSQFGVVSSSDNNLITITPTAAIGSELAGVPYEVILNEGEVYQGRSGSVTDLTGTTVQSSSPVGVFGSHYCANVPTSTGFCDHLTEMLPPSNSFGQSFVTVPFADRENGDSFRVLASEDATNIEINGAFEATLNRGEFFETILTTSSTIESTAPVLLAQFMQGNEAVGPQFLGDPSMMIIPPREQFLGDYTVSTPASGFNSNYLNLVVDGNGLETIALDGLLIPPGAFSPIPGTNFNSAQLEVELGTYSLTCNTAFGVFVYGTNNEDSYAFPGGQVYSDVIEANDLTLSPPSSEASIFTELCFDAALSNIFGEPLEGVRIDFTVQGANTASGFVFTDTNGAATICYMGENEGADVLTAFQGGLSQEVTVSWTEVVSCSNYRYFLADNPTSGGDSKLYEYTLNEESQVAELNELLALPYPFHIAYDGNANLVYVVRSSNGNFRMLDVSSNGALSEEVVLSENLGGAVAAGFDPSGVLYIGSEANNAIYTVDKATGVVEFVRSAPVHGGDLAFSDNGNLYLATRDFGGRIIELNTEGQTSYVQNLPALVTGFAISESGYGLVSIKNRNRVYLGDFTGNLLDSYLLLLDGEPFMKGNGDMASGCDGSFQSGECLNFLTYYTGYPQNNADNELYGISLGEDNSIELTPIEGFSAEDNHIALSPDGLIYAVREDKIDIFDPASGIYVQQNIPIQTHSGQSLSNFPAATFDLNGVLFLGKPSNNTVYSIEFVQGVAEASVAFSGISVSGGDLIATGTPEDQILWLVNRSESTLTNLLDNSFVELELTEVNGACLLVDGRLLLANGNGSNGGGLYAMDLSDFSTEMLSLTGGPEVFFNGDLASGCIPALAALPEFVSTNSSFDEKLSLMPNPSQGMTNIVFSVRENERVTIDILDMSGRVVENHFNQTIEMTGDQRLDFNADRMPNGIYLVRMTSNGFQKVERLVISR